MTRSTLQIADNKLPVPLKFEWRGQFALADVWDVGTTKDIYSSR